jgi:uncharacterized protein YuzB (UPF0349 family)
MNVKPKVINRITEALELEKELGSVEYNQVMYIDTCSDKTHTLGLTINGTIYDFWYSLINGDLFYIVSRNFDDACEDTIFQFISRIAPHIKNYK